MSGRSRSWPPALFVLLLPVVAACQGEQRPGEGLVASPATVGGTSWHELGTWSGRGERQTESFDVTSGSLRLTWETTDDGAPGREWLRVSLHSAISGRVIQTIVETEGAGTGSTSIASEPRVAYLLVESDHVDWHLRLDEGVRRESGPASGQPRPRP